MISYRKVGRHSNCAIKKPSRYSRNGSLIDQKTDDYLSSVVFLMILTSFFIFFMPCFSHFAVLSIAHFPMPSFSHFSLRSFLHFAHFAQHVPSHFSPVHLSQHFPSLQHSIFLAFFSHFAFFSSFNSFFAAFSVFFSADVSCATVVCEATTTKTSARINNNFFIERSSR